MGLHLSFRIHSTSWPKGILIATVFIIGIMSPMVYWTWWAHYGGAEGEQERKIEALGQRDATADARAAIDDKDFVLYMVGKYLERSVPGVGRVEEAYARVFGYEGFSLHEEEPLTAAQKQQNRIGKDYLRQYNQAIFAYVNQHYPGWRDDGHPVLK